jgi:glutaredoxin
VVLKGADLLVGFLEAADQDSSAAVQRGLQPRLALAVANGCPWSSRALRLLRSHGIPVQIVAGDAALQIPQLFLDGQPIGGYRTLINLLTSGGLEQFRDG